MTTKTESRPPTYGPEESSPDRRGSLALAEIHRLSARRFIRVLLVLTAVAYFGIITLMALTVFGKVDAQDLAEAELRRNEFVAQVIEGRERCLKDPQHPPGISAEEACGPPPAAEEYPVESFVGHIPFALSEGLPSGVVPVGSLTAMLAFLIGATYVGAEWSTRSMVALLFWEPRRLKVVGTKLLVIAGGGAVLGLVAQGLWTATALLLARTRGTTSDLGDGFWGEVLAQQARSVLLVMLMALLGFAIANLIRNTGAALGVALVYLIFELVAPLVRPGWQEWLLIRNIFALVRDGGQPITVGPGFGQSRNDPTREIVLSNLHGALVIGGITAVIVAAGVILFKRRDLH